MMCALASSKHGRRLEYVGNSKEYVPTCGEYLESVGMWECVGICRLYEYEGLYRTMHGVRGNTWDIFWIL